MKTRIKIVMLLFMVILSAAVMPKQASAQQGNVSFQVFYDQLSPYGQWVDYPNYGYVWIPDAGPDFVPYSTGGHWIMTEYGWTWVSYYDWGWAPFHYGRWDYDDYYGWLWVPGNEWGPSWVSWRRADGYYGWAPMQPGISINVSFGRAYDLHHDHWMFVRERDFERSDIDHYYVDRSVNERIIVNSTVINTTYIDNSRHVTYVSGPTRNDVQRATGKSVNTVAVREYDKPGQKISDGKLQIYRPQVENNNNTAHKPAPNRVAAREDVKKPSERSAVSHPQNVSPTYNSVKQQQQKQAQPGKTQPQQKQTKPQQQKQPQQQQPQQQQKEQQQPKQTKQQKQPQQNPMQSQQKPAQQIEQQKQQPQQHKQKVQPEQKQPQQQPQPQKSQQPQQQPPQKIQQQQEQQQPQQLQQQPNTASPQKDNAGKQPTHTKNSSPADRSKEKNQPNTVKPLHEKSKKPPKQTEVEQEKKK